MEGDTRVAGTAAVWHKPVPRGFRQTLKVHEDTAEQVKSIRDSINGAADGKVVTNDDVVRLALLTLGTLETSSRGENMEISEETADVIVPLMEHVVAATDPDVLSGREPRSGDSGGED